MIKYYFFLCDMEFLHFAPKSRICRKFHNIEMIVVFIPVGSFPNVEFSQPEQTQFNDTPYLMLRNLSTLSVIQRRAGSILHYPVYRIIMDSIPHPNGPVFF